MVGACVRQLRLLCCKPVFRVADAGAQRVELAFELAMAGLELLEFGAPAAQLLLALDDALVHVAVATDAQPVRSNPDAAARDHGLPGAQAGARRKCFRKGVGGIDALEQRVQPRRPLDARTQRAHRRSIPRRTLARCEERHGPGGQALQHAGHVVDRIHADRLEVGTEHRLDRALPARIHRELLCKSLIAAEASRCKPVDDHALSLAERGALQRIE